ncbi:MAG: hypothetical protein ACI9KE_003968 [Polyangiales bacterium]
MVPKAVEDVSPEDLIENVLERFEARYREGVLFDVDRNLATDMRNEARPAVDALAHALTTGTTSDRETLGHHESLALVTLLARRAAVLGATPSGADRVVRALRQAFADVDCPVPKEAIDALSLASLEGYVRGRDELAREAAQTEAAQSLVTVPLAPGLLALRLYGSHESEQLDSVVEEFARELHRRGTLVAIIDCSGLLRPGRRRAAALLAVDESARMLGVPCVFAGVSAEWRVAFQEAGADPNLLDINELYEDGLKVALGYLGWSLGPTLRERIRTLGKTR